MPRHAVKMISAVVKASASKKIKTKGSALVRRMAHGTLLAMTIASARLDADEMSDKKRLFASGLLDRLRAPLTRHHE